MGQIHGINLGSPAADVTPQGELIVTGSMFKSPAASTEDILVARDQEQILVELLKEAKKINIHLSSITEIDINNEDIEI